MIYMYICIYDILHIIYENSHHLPIVWFLLFEQGPAKGHPQWSVHTVRQETKCSGKTEIHVLRVHELVHDTTRK